MLTYRKIYNINNLEKEWTQCSCNNENLSPFQSFEFVKNMCRYFLPYCCMYKGYPVFYVFYEKEVAKIIIPLFHFIKNTHFPGRTAELFGNVNGCNYCDVIANDSSYLEEAIAILKQKYNTLLFNRVRESSFAYYALRDQMTLLKITNNVRIDVTNTYQEYYQLLSKSVRQNIRTGYNRLSKQNMVFRLEVHRGDTLFNYNPLLDLYVSRHSSKYGVKTSWIKKKLLRYYNFSTSASLSLPNAYTFVLYINETTAAFMSGFVGQDFVFVVPRLSINDDFSFFSPGMLLINETMKYLIVSTNIKSLDLSQGEEEYKYKMGGVKHLTYSFTI